MGIIMNNLEEMNCPDELRCILEEVKSNGGVFIVDKSREEEYASILKVMQGNSLDDLYAFEEEYNDFIKTLRFCYIFSMIVNIIKKRLESEENQQLFISIPELKELSLLPSILHSRMTYIHQDSLDIYQHIINTVKQTEKTKYNIFCFRIRTYILNKFKKISLFLKCR